MNSNAINDLEFKKRHWPGWCPLESEPALFNDILKSLGVKDAQVEEIYDLSSIVEAQWPSNTYGLIFLFRWTDTSDITTAERKECSDVWFANQVVDNSCATLAILNIIFNAPQVDVGRDLSFFREFSQHLSPAYKGLALNSLPCLRQCHNAYARPREMESLDVDLMDSCKRKKGSIDVEDDESFHFIAYTCVDDHLWELDGLKQSPVDLGLCTAASWTRKAAPEIDARIRQYSQDDIYFNLLAVTDSQETQIRSAKNTAESQLRSLDEDLRLELVPGMLEGRADLISKKAECQKLLTSLTLQLQEEAERLRAQNAYAQRRKHDYCCFVRGLLEALHEQGVLEDLVL